MAACGCEIRFRQRQIGLRTLDLHQKMGELDWPEKENRAQSENCALPRLWDTNNYGGIPESEWLVGGRRGSSQQLADGSGVGLRHGNEVLLEAAVHP